MVEVKLKKNTMESKVELNHEEEIDYLTSKRNVEVDKLINLVKNNSDRLKIESQFELLMKKQNQLSLTVDANRVFINSKYGK